jgi:hypothetical protein
LGWLAAAARTLGQGVTATEVKVVVLTPNDQIRSETGDRLPVDLATGNPSTWEQAVLDYDKSVQYAITQFGTYQTWGRTPTYSFVTASEATRPRSAPTRSRSRR